METSRSKSIQQEACSTVPSDGKGPQVLVLGGTEDSTHPSSSIFLLDYNGKIWNKVSIELPQKLGGHGTVIVEDQLYIIGGAVESEILHNLYRFHISGRFKSSRNLYRLNKEMKWEKLADMHEERVGITNSCISHNGGIWVIGGVNEHTSLNTVEKYDPARNTWEQKTAMKRKREYAAAGVINERIYVCGGGENEGRSILDSVEVFDISSEVWTDFCTLPGPRGGMSIVVEGTSIVLIGGIDTDTVEKTVWKMDVEGRDKKWIDLPPLNEGRSMSSAVMIETGCMLLFGGFVNLQPSSSVELFSGQKWESFTPLPQPRLGHTSVVLTPAMIDAFRPYIPPVEQPSSCTIS